MFHSRLLKLDLEKHKEKKKKCTNFQFKNDDESFLLSKISFNVMSSRRCVDKTKRSHINQRRCKGKGHRGPLRSGSSYSTTGTFSCLPPFVEDASRETPTTTRPPPTTSLILERTVGEVSTSVPTTSVVEKEEWLKSELTFTRHGKPPPEILGVGSSFTPTRSPTHGCPGDICLYPYMGTRNKHPKKEKP